MIRLICAVILVSLTSCSSGNRLPETISPAEGRLAWSAGERLDVPLRRVGDHIFIDVSVNGSEPLAFILDTGADITFIDPEIDLPQPIAVTDSDLTVRGLGSVRRAMRLAEGVLLDFGGMSLTDQRVVVLDTAEIEQALGSRVHGFIGWDLLQHFAWELDLRAPALRLYRSRPSTWPSDGWSNFGRRRSVPATFSIGAESMSGQFAIDTGSESHVVVYHASPQLLSAAGEALQLESRGLGGNFALSHARADEMTIAGTVLRQVPVALGRDTRRASYDGLIGLEVLSLFDLLVDGPAGQVRMMSNGAPLKAIPRVIVGMAIEAEGGDLRTLRVQSILPGSPAEAAGLLQGDVVVAVDGQRVDQLILPEVRDRLRAPMRHELIVLRDGRELTLWVEPRVLD